MTACDLLQGWSDNQSWDHTAIVLPDELLLIPCCPSFRSTSGM
jgi:hypothetical protein